MSALAFELPPALEAHEPPEARGIARDAVRLLVADAVRRVDQHTTLSPICPSCSSPATWS